MKETPSTAETSKSPLSKTLPTDFVTGNLFDTLSEDSLNATSIENNNNITNYYFIDTIMNVTKLLIIILIPFELN